jgi:predicted MFS family arabinose efflux permease
MPPEDTPDVVALAAAEHQPFRSRMVIIFAARTVVNTAHRIVYPFLPSIARGLGISLTAASGLVTARMIAGLAAPFFGPLADRHSRRGTMEVALGIFVLAGLLLVSAGTFASGALAAAVAAFAFYGLARVLYDPTVLAYLGDTVPYRERGRAIGIIELCWSSAWLIGVPASGFLIQRFDWRAPWTVLIALGLLSLWLTHTGLPLGRSSTRQRANGHSVAQIAHTWHRILRRRRVAVLLLTSFLLTMALEIPFIVYGAWLETSFGLSLSALGLASIVVGLAEASAEVGTALLTDRLGKRRSVLTGLIGLAASLLILPGLATLGLVAALSGVAVVMLTFEFAIVSLLPLATELAPGERAALLSLNVTAFSLGRIAGAAGGGWLWHWRGESIAPHAIAGAFCALAAVVLMSFGMTEAEDQS